MEEKVSKVQKVKQYILRNKILAAVTACLVICILAMGGTVSSAVDERDLMSAQLQEQTGQYEDLQSSYSDLSAKFDKLQSSYNDLETELTNYQDQQAAIDDLNTQLTDLQEKYDGLQKLVKRLIHVKRNWTNEKQQLANENKTISQIHRP